MTWFTASSVSVNNGQTVVNVNAGDDIQLAQESGGLIIGNNPPVEIKRTFRDGSNLPKIELRSPWPYANQSSQTAVAFPTDGDLAAATAVLKQLIEGFAIATQAQAQAGTDNNNAMTALRVKQAIDFFRPLTTSTTDTTPGRVLKVGDFGLGGIPSDLPNLDNVSKVNKFINRSGIGSVNYPDGEVYTGLNLQNGLPNLKNQIVLRGSLNGGTPSMGTLFFRGSNLTTGVFFDWQKVFDNYNILGTVSQTSGVPTGAIIARGSNANGEFMLLADGTAIGAVRKEVSGITLNPANGQGDSIYLLAGDPPFANVSPNLAKIITACEVRTSDNQTLYTELYYYDTTVGVINTGVSPSNNWPNRNETGNLIGTQVKYTMFFYGRWY